MVKPGKDVLSEQRYKPFLLSDKEIVMTYKSPVE